MNNQMTTVIRLYYQPQTFPCGPQSSCCGPVGQSAEELSGYRTVLESQLPGTTIELVNATEPLHPDRDQPISKLLNSFGASACPIFTLNGEVVSMGPPVMDELAAMLKAKKATA